MDGAVEVRPLFAGVTLTGSGRRAAVADAHRREWAIVLAATVRVTGDLDLAEECVQDAYAAALDAWTRDGVPDRPGAWLTTAARHNALDALRRAGTLRVEAAPAGGAGRRTPDLPTSRSCTTTGCGWSSCAATRRWRSRRRSR